MCSSDLANLHDLTSSARFSFVHADVCDSAIVASLSSLGPFDVVCNLASPASPPAYMANPLATLRAGAYGTDHLARLAIDHGARFLHASTSEVYGDPEVHPQPESYWGHVNPIGPRSMYDESKRYAEALCVALQRVEGLNLRLVRIFNTYGPGMQPDDGRVVTNFINQALRGEALTIYGDGLQTRSFLYVDDLIRGFLALIDSDHGGPVNLGNPDELTMLELADLIVGLTGARVDRGFHGKPGDDPAQRRPDITTAATVLGWAPTISVHDGLQRTIAWFRRHPPAAAPPSEHGDRRGPAIPAIAPS